MKLWECLRGKYKNHEEIWGNIKTMKKFKDHVNIYKSKTKTNKRGEYYLVYSMFWWQPTLPQLKRDIIKLRGVLKTLRIPNAEEIEEPKIFVSEGDVAVGLKFRTTTSRKKIKALGFEIFDWG